MKTEFSMGILRWIEGPARGGRGTAGKDGSGQSLWYDGDELAIIVELSTGVLERYFVTISCDEELFSVTDQDGNEFCAWDPSDWSWWAKIDSDFYPIHA